MGCLGIDLVFLSCQVDCLISFARENVMKAAWLDIVKYIMTLTGSHFQIRVKSVLAEDKHSSTSSCRSLISLTNNR